MTAFWTARGLLRLQQLHRYIARDQPVNANRFVDRLTRQVDDVAANPRLVGRVVPNYRRDDIREYIFEDAYRVIYRIESDGIHVLTVRHASRLLPSRISAL